MSSLFPSRRLSGFAVLSLTLVMAACASLGSAGASPRYSQNVLTESEIDMAHASTLYDAIQRLRPGFLGSGMDASPIGERVVYLNGIRVGGIEELRAMRPIGIREIILLSPAEAGYLLRAEHKGGALLISARRTSPLENL
jgi:hypothetical protein